MIDEPPAPSVVAAAPLDRPTDLRRAAWFMVMSALSFAAMGASVKVASRDVPTTMTVFFRNAIAFAVLVPWAVQAGSGALKTANLGGHLVRSLAGLAAMSCFFTAISRSRLADATVLYQSYPLFLPLIERAWFGQRVPSGVVAALLVGFAGVIAVLRPGGGTLSAVAFIGTGAAFFAAVAQVGIRNLTRTEPVVRIVFYFSTIATLGSAVPLWWTWVDPTPSAWVALVATGLAATVGQFTLTRAYVHAPAALVAPFIYSGVLFAAIVDWVVWQTAPDRWLAIGGALIVAAGAALLRAHGDAESTT